MAKKAEIVFLIKPQFELTPKEVPHGIVKTEENRQKAISSLKEKLSLSEKMCEICDRCNGLINEESLQDGLLTKSLLETLKRE